MLDQRAINTQFWFSYQGTRCNCTPGKSTASRTTLFLPSRIAKMRPCSSSACHRSLPIGFHLIG